MTAERSTLDSAQGRGPGHGCAATIQFLAELFSAAPTFAAVVEGPDLTFRLANPSYERMVGRSGLVGQPIRAALPELEAQGFVASIEQVRATGEPYVGHHVPVRYVPDSAAPESSIERIRDFVYQPLINDQGTPWAVFVHGVDVTEQITLQARLSASALALHETELELDDERRRQFDFLAGMAKDLSNPESRLRQGVTAARRAANPAHIESVATALDRQWTQLLHAVRLQLEALRRSIGNVE